MGTEEKIWMNEKEWVKYIAKKVQAQLRKKDCRVETGLHLAYGHEIRAYKDKPRTKSRKYQTDIAIVEQIDADSWIPRVIVEAKVNSVTTHDAITYSQKADAHRSVHPYHYQ